MTHYLVLKFLTFFVIFIVVNIVSVSCTAKETEVVLVHVVFRHGERTTENVYPTDPNINNTHYPVGLGHLTNRGKMGEYQLGKFLRKEYGDLMGEYFFDDILEARSTFTTRTKMSCQLVLAGLFPPKKLQVWNEELLWQPIPVYSKTKEEEDLLHPEACPRKLAIIENYKNRPEIYEKYIKPYQDLFHFVEKNSGQPIRNVHDLINFFFIIKTEDDLEQEIPDWVRQVYPEPVTNVSSLSYDFLNSDDEVKKINYGYLGKKIIEDSLRKSTSDYKMKMVLYSGHETTVAFTLQFLKVFEPHIPSYGAAVLIELHKDSTDQYYVKIRYRDGPMENGAIDMVIPGCDLLCPFNRFIKLQSKFLPTKAAVDACKL